VGNAKTARVTKADERTGLNEPGLQGAKQHFRLEPIHPELLDKFAASGPQLAASRPIAHAC
jgi:hypothetical protein